MKDNYKNLFEIVFKLVLLLLIIINIIGVFNLSHRIDKLERETTRTIDSNFSYVLSDLSSMKSDISSMETDISSMERDVSTISIYTAP